MYEQGPRHPQFKFNNLFNKHFLLLAFIKLILSRETSKLEVEFKVI